MNPRAYFEVGPLMEAHWTGIPMVTAALAEHALRDETIDWKFFFHSVLVPRDFIQGLVEHKSGEHSLELINRHVWHKQDIDFDDARTASALFPAIKTLRRRFAKEAICVYDFSPLLTPEFHTSDSINHHADRIRGDVESSQQFFCISEASKGDLVAYFGVDPALAPVIPLGVSIDPAALSTAQLAQQLHAVEPYVAVLGTLEPRKNGRLVLEYLTKNPEFCRRNRIVFIGREGWLDENRKLLDELADAGLPRDRVVFTGFVSEAEKIALLYNCAFCIYASFFEGYGLPILEAAALGKLIVCSNSSSMPEVAPDMCLFFDPTDLGQFTRAVERGERRASQTQSPSSIVDIAARLEQLGWERSYRAVADWVKS